MGFVEDITQNIMVCFSRFIVCKIKYTLVSIGRSVLSDITEFVHRPNRMSIALPVRYIGVAGSMVCRFSLEGENADIDVVISSNQWRW